MDGLFDFEEESNFMASQLKVVAADFKEVTTTDWKKLFSGFDEIYAITYSNGIKFTCNLLSEFRKGEIIFGSDNVVSYDIATLFAHQMSALDLTLKNKSVQNLGERLRSGDLHFYVSRDLKSHEKIFILKADDGRTRVICGSANMSYSAFGGVQRENIVYFDGLAAFDYYLALFEDLRDKCSDDMTDIIAARVFKKDESPINVEEVPVFKTVVSKSVVVIDKESESYSENTEYITNVSQLSTELRPVIPKMEEKGSIIITSESVKTVKRKYQAIKKDKEAKQIFRPVLHLDFENRKMTYNDKSVELVTNETGIKNDIKSVYQYFDGLKIFIGTEEQIKQTQTDFFKFMCWFFVSVFCPKLRYVAKQNEFDVHKFPVFGILYGVSNGGKSTFIEFLTKMMSNKKDKPLPSSDFVKTNINGLKTMGEGVPINIDDLAKEQYQNHHENLIKDDLFGISECKLNYPAVTITANKIPALKPDIMKRVVACRIDTRIDRVEGSNNFKMIQDCIKSVSNSLFIEYLIRMFPKIENLEERMKTSHEHFTPDVFELSTETLVEIFTEYSDVSVPDYFRVMTWEDYLGEKATSKYATNKLKTVWLHNKKMFTVDKSKNELIYTMPQSMNYYELVNLADELPAKLNVRQSQYSLIMNLDEAKKHFGIEFKKGLF